MSLMQIEISPQFRLLADKIFNRQLEEDPGLQRELDEQAKRKMYQDVLYNLSFLYTSLELDDPGIFGAYARWLYQLLCPLMKYCTRERVKDLMLAHYALIREFTKEVFDGEKRERVKKILQTAEQETIDAYENFDSDEGLEQFPEKYGAEESRYFECLLKTDTRGAVALISEYAQKGIPLEDIYVEIVGASVRRVGELWHRNRLTVDREHYCTSTSQFALSQMYPLIYRQGRRRAKLIVACVGSELHELGARMVSDLFEYDGWDSVYLGAAVPAEGILSAIREHKPRLAVLSVTMPQHLLQCRDAVKQIQENCPDVKIAVGGNAFENTNEIWRRWSVDFYARDVRELVRQVDDALL